MKAQARTKQEIEAAKMRELSEVERRRLCREEDNRRFWEQMMTPGHRYRSRSLG